MFQVSGVFVLVHRSMLRPLLSMDGEATVDPVANAAEDEA